MALFLQRGYFDRYIATLTAIYKKRCDVMHEALERHFPGGAVKPEYGGAIVWLTLPERVDADRLFERVAPDGVYFETGGFTFADEHHNRHHLRLGYSVIQRSRLLQPGQPVAATGTAAADQELVADEPAAAADENGRAAGQACPLLLAVAG